MPEWKMSEIMLRRALDRLCRLLPDAAQYKCFAALKRATNALSGARFEKLYASWDHLDGARSAPPEGGIERVVSGSGSAPGAGAFAVTHDVDYVGCYRYVPTLLDLDAKLGLKATYNVLTEARYTLEDRVLFAILDKGNEVGLHGRTHDRALGFRPIERIRDFIGSARKELERRIGRVRGFRAPALAVTGNVIKALEEQDFLYDSSLTNSALYSSFTPRFAPFRIGEKGLMEIPLTAQDSMFTNDVPLSREQIGRVITRLIDLATRNGGTLALNFHPIIIAADPEGYADIVRALTKSGLKQQLMKDLVER